MVRDVPNDFPEIKVNDYRFLVSIIEYLLIQIGLAEKFDLLGIPRDI